MNVQFPRELCTMASVSPVVFGSMLVPEERNPTLFSMPAVFICASAELHTASTPIKSAIFRIVSSIAAPATNHTIREMDEGLGIRFEEWERKPEVGTCPEE